MFIFQCEFVGENDMSRKINLKPNLVISVRIEVDMSNMLHDIAALESINSGQHITVQELIRNALNYVYSDNERLRECFRRSRTAINRRVKYNT
jgi:hypothetical protein